MTDAEMVRWLRDRARHADLYGHASTHFLLIADRLEALRTPPARCPVGPAREAEIRDDDRLGDRWGLDLVRRERRDLLDLLDHERAARVYAECVVQDLLAEDDRYDAGVKAGLARALAAIEARASAWRRSEGGPPVARDRLHAGIGALDQAAADVARCGPALAPPHQATHARMMRLEAAMANVAAYAVAFRDGTIREIATKALEE